MTIEDRELEEAMATLLTTAPPSLVAVQKSPEPKQA